MAKVMVTGGRGVLLSFWSRPVPAASQLTLPMSHSAGGDRAGRAGERLGR
jgi:hypothetical protein